MPSMTPTLSVSLSEQEEIGRWLAAHGTPQQVALRGRIVLGAAAGQSDSVIARQLGTNRKTVMLWRRRFSEQGSESLWEVAPGRGRKPTYGSQGHCECDPTNQTQGNDPVELPTDGGKPEGEQVDGQQHLAQPQSQAAPGQELQAVARSSISGKTHRCGRSLSESSTADSRALR